MWMLKHRAQGSVFSGAYPKAMPDCALARLTPTVLVSL